MSLGVRAAGAAGDGIIGMGGSANRAQLSSDADVVAVAALPEKRACP